MRTAGKSRRFNLTLLLRHRPNAARLCQHGCTSTTITDPTPPRKRATHHPIDHRPGQQLDRSTVLTRRIEQDEPQAIRADEKGSDARDLSSQTHAGPVDNQKVGDDREQTAAAEPAGF